MSGTGTGDYGRLDVDPECWKPRPLSPNGARNSPNSNYQTPSAIVAVARELLGGIDLDPASCVSANERVRANVWHGPGGQLGDSTHGVADGLSCEWFGRIFLNPPSSLFAPFYRKLLSEYASGRVKSAFLVCFSIDALQTTQRHNEGGALAFPCFVPDRRIAYIDPETGEPARVYNAKTGKWSVSPPKPSVFVWLPAENERDQANYHLRREMTDAFRMREIDGVACGGVD